MLAALGCCLLSALTRSAAYVTSPGVFKFIGRHAVATGGALGAAPSCALLPSCLPLSIAAAGLGDRGRRTRRTQLSMDLVSNPITSRQYGRSDGKAKSKGPDMNEDISVSTVAAFGRVDWRSWLCLVHYGPFALWSSFVKKQVEFGYDTFDGDYHLMERIGVSVCCCWYTRWCLYFPGMVIVAVAETAIVFPQTRNIKHVVQ